MCRAERCAVHHLQTGRQGCLGSLFLPRYERSLDLPRRSGSTFSVGVLGQLLSQCDHLLHPTTHNHARAHTNTRRRNKLQVRAGAVARHICCMLCIYTEANIDRTNKKLLRNGSKNVTMSSRCHLASKFSVRDELKAMRTPLS